jgi:hypothetical protein
MLTGELKVSRPTASITRARGSGKTRSLARTFETKTGQLIERGAQVGYMPCWAALKLFGSNPCTLNVGLPQFFW